MQTLPKNHKTSPTYTWTSCIDQNMFLIQTQTLIKRAPDFKLLKVGQFLGDGCLKMGWKYPLRFFRLQTYLSDMEVWNISSSKILMPKWNRCTTSSLGQCTYIMWYWLVWFKKQHAFLCFLFDKSVPNIPTRTLNFEIIFLQKLWC